MIKKIRLWTALPNYLSAVLREQEEQKTVETEPRDRQVNTSISAQKKFMTNQQSNSFFGRRRIRYLNTWNF